MKPLLIFCVFLLYPASGDVDVPDIDIPEVNLDDFAVVKDKCDKAGAAAAYDKLKASKSSLQTCITTFANASVVKSEVEEAKKTGSMDEVFGKYCAKRPKLATCVEDFVGNLRPCLNGEENKALNVTLSVLKELGDFVCFKDGDRIAMFIAEGGVECIQSRTEGIKSCVNTTFKIEAATVNSNTIPSLLMDKKKCDDLGKLQVCVVEELEKCDESTPANIVDALFKFIKKSACKKKNKRSVQIHNLIKRSTGFIDSIYDTGNLKNNFMNVFQEKCNENAPDGGYEAFTLTLESAVHCIQNKSNEEQMLITPAVTIKETMERCVGKLIEKTEACLPEDEKYWPKFYLEVVESIIDFAYANKNIFLNSKRVELVNCFQNFKGPSGKKELMKCLDVPNPKTLKKEGICGNMISVTGCFKQHITKKCIPDVNINKLVEDFTKAVTGPCTK